LVMRRSLPGAPTDTVFAKLATEPLPSATELGAVAELPAPRARDPVALALAPAPKAETLIATRNAELALRRAAGTAGNAAKPDGSRSDAGCRCRLPNGGRLRAARRRIGAALECSSNEF
jgi:hypothetical protein